VDIEVAPDGSLFLSDHNQGIWRILHDPGKKASISLMFKGADTSKQDPMEALLTLPQPGAEFSRVRSRALIERLGANAWSQLQSNVLNDTQSLKKKLRAVRELAPEFSGLNLDFLQALATDVEPDLRAQAAWLLGLRGDSASVPMLKMLFSDRDPFVRRRAAEAFTRFQHPDVLDALVQRLSDPDRLIAYVSMIALAHYPSEQWLHQVIASRNLRTQFRALSAANLRREKLPEEVVAGILEEASRARLSPDAELEFLRVLALFRESEVRKLLPDYFLRNFQTARDNIRWEQVRLIGEFGIGELFPKLLRELEGEDDHVTQFHIAQALARLPNGWTSGEETRLVRWFLKKQEGWFAQFAGKGVEFPMFWQTVLSDFAAHHPQALLAQREQIDYAGLLGAVTLDLIAKQPGAADELIQLYQTVPEARAKIVRAMKNVRSPKTSEFLRKRYSAEPDLRNVIALSLAAQESDAKNRSILIAGLGSSDSDVVRACAKALAESKLDRELAQAAISKILERANWFYAVEGMLIKVSNSKPPEYQPPSDSNRRPNEAVHKASVAFWKRWYETQFGEAFAPLSAPAISEKSDEEIHAFLLSDRVKGGSGSKGARMYENLQCNSCHGGGVTPGREGKLFGPDLAGVGKRLTPLELADSLVYPSKQVADRFKAFEVEMDDATPLSGFITEQNDKYVTLADREQVHRIPRAKIRSLTPQKTSLMPERLINRLSWDEIRDLMAFLSEGSK